MVLSGPGVPSKGTPRSRARGDWALAYGATRIPMLTRTKSAGETPPAQRAAFAPKLGDSFITFTGFAPRTSSRAVVGLRAAGLSFWQVPFRVFWLGLRREANRQPPL